MSAGKLTEPKVISDFNQKTVCLLPTGFYFNDERWEKIWQRYEEKNATLSMADLKQLFPDEATVQNAAIDNGDTFERCRDKK
jgi:exopolysaccharide biosynthesis predicted pyruvyltransferase EpsI